MESDVMRQNWSPDVRAGMVIAKRAEGRQSDTDVVPLGTIKWAASVDHLGHFEIGKGGAFGHRRSDRMTDGVAHEARTVTQA